MVWVIAVNGDHAAFLAGVSDRISKKSPATFTTKAPNETDIDEGIDRLAWVTESAHERFGTLPKGRLHLYGVLSGLPTRSLRQRTGGTFFFFFCRYMRALVVCL